MEPASCTREDCQFRQRVEEFKQKTHALKLPLLLNYCPHMQPIALLPCPLNGDAVVYTIIDQKEFFQTCLLFTNNNIATFT